MRHLTGYIGEPEIAALVPESKVVIDAYILYLPFSKKGAMVFSPEYPEKVTLRPVSSGVWSSFDSQNQRL